MFSIANSQERRGTSQFDIIYRFRGLLPEADNDMDVLFLEVLGEILNFVDEIGGDVPEAAFTGESFHRKRKSAEVTCVGMRYRHLWAGRINHYRDEEPNTRRFMIHDITLTETAKGLELGYQVIAEYHLGQPVAFTPDFIFKLSDRIGLYQNTGPAIDGTPLLIQDESQVDELLELVADPERYFPVVVISEVNSYSWRSSPNAPRVVLNPHDLARHLRGYAFVAHLTYDANKEWQHRVGRVFSVYDGAIRTFYPSADFMNSSGKDHPGLFKDQIPTYQFKNQRGARGYFAFLVHRMRQHSATAKIPWSKLYFLQEATQLQHEINLYAASRPKATTKASAKIVAQIEKEQALTLEELKKKDAKIAELEEGLMVKEIEISELQAQVENLNFHLSPGPTKSCDNVAAATAAIPITASISYADMAERCASDFAGKLILLKRAEHSLTKAQYESPLLVFQALELLANEYRDSQMGKITNATFLEKCRDVGVTFSDIRRKYPNRSDDIYTVNYPQGSQKVEQLRYVLCKGNSKKRRYRMRLYFFWSERDSLVVVGDLPQQIGDK